MDDGDALKVEAQGLPRPRPRPRQTYSLLRAARVALHLLLVVAITVRSARIGNVLHPYERVLANEWIHLLFFVETTTTIPTYDSSTTSSDSTHGFTDTAGDTMCVPVVLPNFLLESEEEIAANVDDEFFSRGFAARASSLPVGVLFTINETRKHLHGAVANYFALPETALGSYHIAGDDKSESERSPLLTHEIPFPQLVVFASNDSGSTEHKYILHGKNESEYPAPLRLATPNSNRTETRAFFDDLDGMELSFIVGVTVGSEAKAAGTIAPSLFEWWVVITYDLQSQGHLEVSINFGLRPQQHPANQENSYIIGGEDRGPTTNDLAFDRHSATRVPSIFFEQDTFVDWCLLVLVGLYQAAELALQRQKAAVTASAGAKPLQHLLSRWCSTVLLPGGWFWFTLALNLITLVCVLVAWQHTYRLYLWDALCLAFATVCALQWVSMVRYLGALHPRFQILGLTLQRGLPRVAQFLVGVSPIFVGYVLFGTIMFGAKVPRFQSAGATATTLFAVANGDEVHDTFNDVAFSPWVGQLYVYSYLILFSYVVLMVCIGIIEDAFFSAVFPTTWPSLATADAPRSFSSSRGSP